MPIKRDLAILRVIKPQKQLDKRCFSRTVCSYERYSLALARLSRECGCSLLDLRAAFLEKWDPKPYYCRDGIHPNCDGQILLGEATLAAIS